MADTNVRVLFDPDCSREFDIANTHDDNHTLFQREDIKKFYEEMDKVTVLTDNFIEWLGNIPRTMSNTAIPLFRENKTGTDYQVHPFYSELRPSQRPACSFMNPHSYVCLVDLGSQQIPVIPFGGLFINVPIHNPSDPDQTGRLSKFTGYEVLFGLDKRLWFVFNHQSLGYSRFGWYPVPCSLWGKLEERGEQADLNTPANRSDKRSPSPSLNTVIESPDFRSAYISLTESTLSSMTFAEAQEQIKRTMRQGGEASIGNVSANWVDCCIAKINRHNLLHRG
ncbi:hypothetical protein O1611_g2273 [Lasiodiplodia mahajangana]|uniref:Uncharacterized protein n=1 Tax=Lasiodiplodia mahajangana TaxID=1108764 RepID=A0ACC2JVQ1_9PEZI|nr:hypothetical protein O1611_g2273 [Lasiodiplodia mahajangana]